MRRMAMLLAPAAFAAVFVVACGSSAAPSSEEGGAGVGATIAAKPTVIARGSGLDRPALQRAVVDEPPDMEVTIDSCTWEANEAGGPVELNVTFSVLRLGPESLFATFRVHDKNNTSLLYRPTGFDSGLTAGPGETTTKSLHTSKFPVGSPDLELVISGQRRKTVTFPLDNCTQP